MRSFKAMAPSAEVGTSEPSRDAIIMLQDRGFAEVGTNDRGFAEVGTNDRGEADQAMM